jgi:hypothetical protein
VAAVYTSARLVVGRHWKAFVTCAIAGALPMVATLALSGALGYVDTSGAGNPLVRIGPNPLALNRVGWTLFLNFGSLAAVALIGLVWAAWRRQLGRFLPVAIVIGVCAAFYFLVDVPDHDSVYVAWRASHLAYIALGPLCGFALQEGWAQRGLVRVLTVTVAAGAGAAALPTTAIEVYNAQDVSNRAMGPGFRWTVILNGAEQEALSWIGANTPPTARVQVDARARGRDTWAYVPAFAGRRMAGGLPIGMIPVAKYEAVSNEVKGIYVSDSAADVHERSLGLCVDYLLVIGEPERRANPRLQPAP